MKTPASHQYTPGSIHLSRTSKAEVDHRGHLYLSTETDDLELRPGEIAQLANFLRDQREHPQLQERLDLLKAHILRGEATRGAAETILFEMMVSFLPTPLLHQVQDIMALLNNSTVQDER